MVSGGGGADLTAVPTMSGLVAARYLLTVFLLIPNSLAEASYGRALVPSVVDCVHRFVTKSDCALAFSTVRLNRR